MKDIIDSTFKLTPEGIHLLRNKYTYRLILYSEIENAFLKKGRSVKNWAAVLILGFICLGLLMLFVYYVINSALVPDKSVRLFNLLGHGLIAILVLGGISVFSIYNALKMIPVIEILVNGRFHKLRILRNREEVLRVLEYLDSQGVRVMK
ncbi:hypothetical protein [Algoriphagus antarcticus]|uniref:Uncharacterized protein n=1 Tax=Algoriphagus antarcticus TaxID=238540 RepID=A0A3E0D1S3_9BACT|nr:hypothetical protein [Algoriphagus antarcticus]REG75205.1 hypothetical protein C8N25_1622 [Algoriphagus antarcticus]